MQEFHPTNQTEPVFTHYSRQPEKYFIKFYFFYRKPESGTVPIP